jgi:mRNA interferase RelE/StbE
VTSYSLSIKSSAQRELDAVSDEAFARIDRKIAALTSAPRPSGCAKLAGYRDLWRIRVGDYRVIYIIDDAQRHVSVIRVAHRREVYQP